ncbi:recombination directionality factor [Longimycelium tulufanense]|uniref:recombination directionality factor n=1 Tax=Longimycelium tulufanense TaxID=907463 RepID=UPI00166508A3|nr:hypothetical protein [Longimycelium tulufanense]
MSLRIYETDPDAKPRPRNPFVDDVVGRVSAGMMQGRRPVALSTFRFCSDDPAVTDRVAELYGGTPEDYDENTSHVITDAVTVDAIVDGPDALRSSLILFGPSGPIHHCDGVEFLEPPEDRGTPCGCPPSLRERKDLARSGRGPKPHIELRFRLHDDPELGYFVLRTSSWSTVAELPAAQDTLEEINGPAKVRLVMEHVEYTTKAGRAVSYHYPALTVIGAA